jgi:hypothetical protein
MGEEPQRSLRAIHDLERAIRVWELLRDYAQRVLDQATTCSEKHEASVESSPAVANVRACIDRCNTSNLAAKARINDLEEKD